MSEFFILADIDNKVANFKIKIVLKLQPLTPKKTKDSDKAKARAAMLFNRAVRDCVDNSDPDTMRSILRDPANKNYALDAIVLKTVMKAYVMAAMFEDETAYAVRHARD